MSFDKQHVMGAAAGLRSRVGELDQIRKQGSDNTVMLEVHLVALAYFVEANVETICAALEASPRQEERLREQCAQTAIDACADIPWLHDAAGMIARAIRQSPPHAKDAADV